MSNKSPDTQSKKNKHGENRSRPYRIAPLREEQVIEREPEDNQRNRHKRQCDRACDLQQSPTVHSHISDSRVTSNLPWQHAPRLLVSPNS